MKYRADFVPLIIRAGLDSHDGGRKAGSGLAGEALVAKVVGGAGGGGAKLTSAGERLLLASERLQAARKLVLQKLDKESSKQIDMPNLEALGLRTSMRNLFPCIIGKLKKQDASIGVELVLSDGTSLFSRITRESAELLALVSGQSALLLCKATAVGVASKIEKRKGFNLLSGTVTRTAAARGGEISLQLDSGLQLVGFAEARHGVKVGQIAMAAVEESGVVIAVRPRSASSPEEIWNLHQGAKQEHGSNAFSSGPCQHNLPAGGDTLNLRAPPEIVFLLGSVVGSVLESSFTGV